MTVMFLALTQKSLNRWSPSTCDTATILRERSTRFRVERTLKDTLCAAALTENLFHDNSDDCLFLESDEGRLLTVTTSAAISVI